MRAMVLKAVGTPLELEQRQPLQAGDHDLVIRVEACGVCRTDLHVVDGELAEINVPVVPGHQIVGVVDRVGDQVSEFSLGDRVGVPWLGHTCGACQLCHGGRENLCCAARFTGHHIDGGFAEQARADSRYAFAIPSDYQPVQAAPLLCAGLIGYRSLGMAGDGARVGLYGFGAAAHIVAQVLVHQRREVFAITREGDGKAQAFARSLGAAWAGGSDSAPPVPLDAAIIFAPVGALVPKALSAVAPGGTVVCAGIHMSDIPSFPYSLLWQERVLRSVANLTRKDGEAFFELAPAIPVRTHVTEYPLEQAQRALDDLRAGRFEGAAVVVPGA